MEGFSTLLEQPRSGGKGKAHLTGGLEALLRLLGEAERHEPFQLLRDLLSLSSWWQRVEVLHEEVAFGERRLAHEQLVECRS